ncbi:MAG: peptidoglycan-binding protein, partial [Methanobrevibacter sp.]|nr:peptidoglycan-binding protein [Methanobrevibacter sp.]
VDKKIIKLGDSVKYTPSSVGIGNVTAHASVNYLGETRVFDENANVLLNIEKSNPVLIINDITFDYNSTGSTVIYYEGASGVVANVINQPNAVISIGYNRITVSNLDAGQYTLSVTTISATGYDAITEYCRITVNQIDSDLSLDDGILDWGKSVNITVNTNGTTGITAKINNQTVNVTNYTIPISDLDAGLYTLSVTTIADANHNPVTKEANVTVNKVDSVISLNDVELDYGSSVNVTVAAEGAVGITALIDNESVEVNNFTILISGLNVGSHVLTVTSVADANHNPVNKTVKVTVNKLNSELTATEITTTYNVNKNIVVTLTDINGNPIGGVNVTVYLNGEKTFTTDSNGQINVSTGSLAPKTYTASITFNGTDIYAKSAKDVNVTVKKATPKITAKNKTFKTTTKTKKYTITLKDNVGKVIKNAKVTLKVKGVTYKATTNSKGKATFKITKLGKKGTYKATVTYKGNSYYNKATKKVKITVKKPFKTVSSGSKDTSTVKKIQRALKSNGYYLKADGKTLKVDGKYDKYTISAVKEFQKDNALKVTGKVDEKTAKKLKII